MADPHVAAVRSFNRFYTRQIGVLREGMLDSAFSLTEGRILYELAHRQKPTASELARDLDLDAGYLSRILRKFEKRGLLSRRISAADRRQSHLVLTAAGQRVFASLDTASDRQVGGMLERLNAAERTQLVQAMQSIEGLIRPPAEKQPAYLLRSHRVGDMGWIVYLHGTLYAREYGWGERFEALVAEIAAHFIQNFDARREHCWIAEKDGVVVGSVFLVRQSDEVAKLRLLIVDPAARGLGIGNRLVLECIRFARQAGYRTITLWTQDVLRAAHHLYVKNGFRHVRDEEHSAFGIPMTGQIWELTL